MRFLADMGVSLLTVAALRAAGHDATPLREEGLHRMAEGKVVIGSEDGSVYCFGVKAGR